MTTPTPLRYKRILLKLSGEALMGEVPFGIDPTMIRRIAGEVDELNQAGAEIAMVIGAGNLFRGAGLAAAASTSRRMPERTSTPRGVRRAGWT